MAQKRDAAYYRSRLKKEFPSIYGDLLAGRIKSVRQAAAAAGLIHLPNRLTALQRDWRRASPQQRGEFLKWVKASGIGLRTRPYSTIADASGILTPRTIAFIRGWISSQRISAGQIMKEIGYSNFDYRLAQALNGSVRLPPDVLAALKPWLAKRGL